MQTLDNSIVALRTTLFETLHALGDKTNPMDIDRAKAISEVAQTIINSAKVEVDHLRVTGGKGSGFIPEVPKVPMVNTPGPVKGVTVHHCK